MRDTLMSAGVSIVALVASGFAWVWRLQNRVSTSHIELGICKSDVAWLKTESQHLRDKSVRQETQINIALAQLTKLDQIGVMVASVEAMRVSVDRLESQVVPRKEVEQLTVNLLDRMRAVEEKALNK